jgi:hypothetical protein
MMEFSTSLLKVAGWAAAAGLPVALWLKRLAGTGITVSDSRSQARASAANEEIKSLRMIDRNHFL